MSRKLVRGVDPDFLFDEAGDAGDGGKLSEDGHPRITALVLPEPTSPHEAHEWRAPLPHEIIDTWNCDDTTQAGVAKGIAKQLISQFGAVGGTAKSIYIWDETHFRRLPDDFAKQAAYRMHGSGKDPDNPKKKPVNAHKEFVAGVEYMLAMELSMSQQVAGFPTAEEFFEDSPCLVTGTDGSWVWSGSEVEWHENTRKLRSCYAFDFPLLGDKPQLRDDMLQFLHGVFPGVEAKERDLRIKAMIQHAGLTILGAQRYQADLGHPVLVGPPRCGKSRWGEIVTACMPEGSVSTGQWADQCQGGFEAKAARECYLHARLFVVDDASTKPIRDTGTLKTVTGFGRVTVGGHGWEQKDVLVRAGHLVLSNHLIAMSDNGHGMSRRMIYIELPGQLRFADADARVVPKLLGDGGQAQFVRYCIHEALLVLRHKTGIARPECHFRMLRTQRAVSGDTEKAAAVALVQGAYESCEDRMDGVSSAELYAWYCREHLDICGGSKSQTERTRLNKTTFSILVCELTGEQASPSGSQRKRLHRLRLKSLDD